MIFFNSSYYYLCCWWCNYGCLFCAFSQLLFCSSRTPLYHTPKNIPISLKCISYSIYLYMDNYIGFVYAGNGQEATKDVKQPEKQSAVTNSQSTDTNEGEISNYNFF